VGLAGGFSPSAGDSSPDTELTAATADGPDWNAELVDDWQAYADHVEAVEHIEAVVTWNKAVEAESLRRWYEAAYWNDVAKWVEGLQTGEAEARSQARIEAANGRTRQQGQAISDGVRRVVGGGSFQCPVAGAVNFVDSFGAARSGGRRHQGTDMMAASGTPVVAPVAGVVSTSSSGAGGLTVHLAGNDGVTYEGMHLSSFGATGSVAAGTVIGYVGATGNARGGSPHLHFEMHPGGGGAVNPYSTVAQHC
jgi:murein DD-endopeptidase MepM/ murein hydrolase activator NlpD